MKFLPLALIVTIFAFPESASAVGLVPCSGADCQACHFVTLGNTILKWLIGVLFVVFGVVAVMAGVGLVTSGGNPSAKQEAKSKLMNAFVGMLIVLGAWLLVDTVMRGLLVGDEGSITGYGPWSQISCAPPKVYDQVGPPEATCTGGACVPLGSVPCKDPNSCTISSSMQAKLAAFHAQAGVAGARVTEAMPPTRNHSNPCHLNGTCVDYGVAGGVKNPEDIKAIINAAVNNGLTPKYEVGTQAEVDALISAGVPARYIERPLGNWITAPHFSIYEN